MQRIRLTVASLEELAAICKKRKNSLRLLKNLFLKEVKSQLFWLILKKTESKFLRRHSETDLPKRLKH